MVAGMAALILHPFTLRVDGSVACAEQDSDAYIGSQIAVIVSTRMGERDMCPTFGVADPVFADLSEADIQTCLDAFGPDDIDVVSVTAVTTGDAVEVFTVDWSPR